MKTLSPSENLDRLDEAQLRALVKRLSAENASLASLSDFLQTHTEREKASLARELHDSLGGILTPAKMDLAWLEARLGKDPQFQERLKRLGALIDEGIDLKRRIIEKLRPSLLDHLGLASALQWYVDDACRAAKLDCKMRVSERLERLPPDLEIALFRVVQESLANVVKHAKAKSVDFSLDRTEKGLSLCIADDGVGIEDVALARALTHGLKGIEHRVRSLTGTFEVVSKPGSGTKVEIFVPLQK